MNSCFITCCCPAATIINVHPLSHYSLFPANGSCRKAAWSQLNASMCDKRPGFRSIWICLMGLQSSYYKNIGDRNPLQSPKKQCSTNQITELYKNDYLLEYLDPNLMWKIHLNCDLQEVRVSHLYFYFETGKSSASLELVFARELKLNPIAKSKTRMCRWLDVLVPSSRQWGTKWCVYSS